MVYVSYVSIDVRGSRFATKLPTSSEINVCPRTKRFVRLIAKSRLVITDTQSEAREVDLRYFCVYYKKIYCASSKN